MASEYDAACTRRVDGPSYAFALCANEPLPREAAFCMYGQYTAEQLACGVSAVQYATALQGMNG